MTRELHTALAMLYLSIPTWLFSFVHFTKCETISKLILVVDWSQVWITDRPCGIDLCCFNLESDDTESDGGSNFNDIDAVIGLPDIPFMLHTLWHEAIGNKDVERAGFREEAVTQCLGDDAIQYLSLERTKHNRVVLEWEHGVPGRVVQLAVRNGLNDIEYGDDKAVTTSKRPFDFECQTLRQHLL